MKIARVRAHHLDNIPIQPPPFRNLPNVERAILVEIETDGGIVGWAMAGYAHPIIVGFINKHVGPAILGRSEEHTSELQSLMRISYAVFCLKKKKQQSHPATTNTS